MTLPTTAIDEPFPGAHSQVPGQRLASGAPITEGSLGTPRRLPLESTGAAVERGWVIRLPVRAESVAIDKHVVVYERVGVGRRETDDVAHLEGRIRREELRVERRDADAAGNQADS